MHRPGASAAKIVHPAVCPCVLPYIKVVISKEKHAHIGCTGAKLCAPGSQSTHRVQGAPLISNTVWRIDDTISILRFLH